MARAIMRGRRGPDRRIRLFAVAVTFLWCLPIGRASATYTGIVLFPLNPPAGPHQQIAGAGAAANGQVVGASLPNSQYGIQERALLWNGGPTPVDLGPGQAVATDGTQQVGMSPGFDGMLWTGTAASAVDLGSYMVPQGVGGGEQVGTNMQYALLWHGTPGSLVKLSGNDSQALGTDGVHQVGMMGFREPHAMLWSGTAASAVDLHPVQFQNVGASEAVAVSGSQQVGYTTSPGLGQIQHAVLWTGTASSAVDLNPQGSTWSHANGTNGFQQVGVMTLSFGGERAVVWTGTANSAVDLQALLPAHYTQSIGSSIDPAGNVFGSANDSAGNFYAVEWLPHAVVPGDANLDGKVDFSDLVTLARNYGQAGGWLQGDFDGDGTVGFDDLTILARNYGQALTASQLALLDPSFRSDVAKAFADVPEPSSIAIVSVAAGTLLCRRGRMQ